MLVEAPPSTLEEEVESSADEDASIERPGVADTRLEPPPSLLSVALLENNMSDILLDKPEADLVVPPILSGSAVGRAVSPIVSDDIVADAYVEGAVVPVGSVDVPVVSVGSVDGPVFSVGSVDSPVVSVGPVGGPLISVESVDGPVVSVNSGSASGVDNVVETALLFTGVGAYSINRLATVAASD
jgi:hypothetical protein